MSRWHAQNTQNAQGVHKPMGVLYVFTTVGDARVVKVGHTRQENVSSRFRGYLGPSKPRMIIAQCPVADSERAEADMLRLCQESRHVRPRTDFGPEWFECPGDLEACHAALFFYAHLASRSPSQPRQGFQCDAFKQASPNAYQVALQRFATLHAPAAALTSAEHLVDCFESRDECPFLHEFLPWPREQRVAWANEHLTRCQLFFPKSC